ncbi:MAG: hypothetical protein KF749_04225 [Bacteroidetes bacterium]|nr:hypothetical protein [Bacteroidota bacterium]MCW5897203.1 hypothetical protein [Bacteroidota bacterium]
MVHLLRHRSANEALRPYVGRAHRSSRISSISSILLASVLLIVALPTLSFPQQLALRTYTRATGLPSNYIFSLYQDRDGFMWFGTDRGVSVYDGHHFRNYSTFDGLPANLIYSIHQSSDGTMWFGTYKGGACSFDGRQFRTYSTQHGLPDSVIPRITEDKFGRIYLQSHSGVSVLFRDSISVASERSSVDAGLLFQHDGAIYCVGRGTLTRITPTNDHHIASHTIELPPQTTRYSGQNASSVLVREGGEVWLGGLNAIAVLEIEDKGASVRLKKTITLPGSLPTVYGMSEENDSTIWAATRIGLFRIAGDSIRLYKKEEGIDPEFLQSMFRDHEGSLWLGTFGGGAKRLSHDHISFFTIESGLPTANISAVFCDSKQNVWLGGNRFLGMLDRDGRLSLRNSSFAEVRAVAENPQGKILVGTFEFLYGPSERDGFRRTLRREDGVRVGGGVSTIYFDSAGGRWSGSYGSGTYHTINGRTRLLDEADGMPSQMIEGIVPGYNSLWFLSRDNGASRLRDGVFEKFSVEQGLPSHEIYSVFEEEETIWFGTGKGLARMHKGRAAVINEKFGLQGNSVLWIGKVKGVPDALWILTERSLHQLRAGELISFGSSMLRPTPAASITQADYRLSDNSLWIATTGGVSKIDLDQLEQNTVPPRVRITGLLNDTLRVFFHMPTRELPNPQPVDLEHFQNNISISFAGLSYLDEEDVRYRFKLEPLEEDWSRLTRDREVHYRNLNDGNYTFSVLAINGNNVVSAVPATISFTILPPFWERWWFIASMVLVVAGAFGGIVRYVSVRKLRKKVDELERERAIQAERERISRDLHDHVGAQLVNIISGLDLVGKYSPPAETRAQRLLKALQQDARSSMLQLRETIWAMKTESMTLDRFAAQVEAYSRRQMELQDATELSVEFSSNPAIELTPTQALNCFRFVQEALTNCVKHARASLISVTLSSPGSDRICISVKDNGVGMRRAAGSELEGNGVTNMRRRAEELGGLLWLESSGRGTEVKFEIPVRIPDADVAQ